MANCVHCDIVSVKEAIYSGSVQMIIAHGRAGDLGVLAGHAPLLTQLKPGPVRVIKRTAALAALQNQKSEMDTAAALATLAEIAGQIRTIQQMKNRA